MNTAISIISDTIGKDVKSSAFLYGAYSFIDKIVIGTLVFLSSSLIENAYFLRLLVVVNPSLMSLFAVILIH